MTDVNDKTSEKWLTESQQSHRELFSELDVLLRALNSYFYAGYLPIGDENVVSRNFYKELTVAYDAIFRIVSILEIIIPERIRNTYWFQKFTENKLSPGKERESIRHEIYRQDTKEKSLTILFDSLINLKTIIMDILKSRSISYMSFKNVGQLIDREFRTNVFFNPSRHEIDPEMDSIENRVITDIVKGINDKETRKRVSIIFLSMFRFLRRLNHINHATTRLNVLNCSILILMLLRVDIDKFKQHIAKFAEITEDRELKILLQALSYQFSMESKRVFQQELKKVFDKTSAHQLRGKIENSHGILKNLTEQAIIQLSKYWNPETKEEEIFEMFITKTGQSLKLREDVYILHRILIKLEQISGEPEEMKKVIGTLINFLAYFESFTFKLLRYDDYEEFTSFFKTLKGEYRKKDFGELVDRCHDLNVFLETMLRQVDNRAELLDHPMDYKKAEYVVKQYLPS